MSNPVYADDTWIPRIEIGDRVDEFADWAEDTFEPVFNFIKDTLNSIVEHVTDGLQAPPAWVMILIFTGIALLVRGWRFAIVSFIGFGLIDSMEKFDGAMQTLTLVVVAAVFAVALSIPIGILAARSPIVSQLVRPILDFMQTMPAMVYLLPAMAFFSVGVTTGIAATVIFAMPPGVRLTELGIRQVDQEMVEAGEAFGAPPHRVLTGIQIPLAMPSIMAGVNQVIMLSLSMVVLASMVAAPGLGADVFYAVTQIQFGAGFEAGLGVVIIAIYLDRITAALGSRSAIARAQRAESSV